MHEKRGRSNNLQILSEVLLRGFLPFVLLSCALFRPCLLSFIYLLLYLYLPFVPTQSNVRKRRTEESAPTENQNRLGTHLRIYLKLLICISTLTVLSQFVFQIVLLSLPPYGDFLEESSGGPECTSTTTPTTKSILRWLGFIKLTSLQVVDLLRWVLPDVIALITSLVTYYVLNKISTNGSSTVIKSITKLYYNLGIYLNLTLFCLTSSLEPSIVSSVYYFLFLFGSSCWALKFNLHSKFFAIVLFWGGLGTCFVHLIAEYFYQTEVGRGLIDPLIGPETQPSLRLIGLVDFVKYNCGNGTADPRILEVNEDLSISSWLSPLMLLIMYQLLVYQVKILLFHTQKKQLVGGTSPVGTTVQEYGTLDQPERFSRQFSRTSSQLERQQTHDTASLPASNGEDDLISILISAMISLFDLFIKSSYIGTNIIMMAWSITYHSWLTFVLLIWACLLWMFPNQRRAMLVSSPVLVIYSEILLVIQYVYSLDYPFPEEIDNFNLKEIGLVKSRVIDDETFGPIAVKSLYTLMFWITLRQYIMERQKAARARREEANLIQDAAHESFRITIGGTNVAEDLLSPHTQSGSLASALRRRFSSTVPQNDQIVTATGRRSGVGQWIKKILIKFWIWVVAVMLFIIGLGGGDKVVLYRIVYMALFLIFILTFQLSYSCWRKMMYSFWLTLIIYSMFVLVLIYTYQFEDIPQYLSNYTGIPTQLQKDIGLERFDTGDLFVRLLTPTFFLVITVIQLHYFHKEFLEISEIKSRSAEKSEPGKVDNEPPSLKPLLDDMSLKNIIKNINYYGKILYKQSLMVYTIGSQIIWRFLEIHMLKIVLLSMFLLSVFDKSLLHLILCIMVVIAVVLYKESLQRVLIHFCSIYISVLFLLKMIYQIDYISHSYWDNNCTTNYTPIEVEENGMENLRMNDAEWLGLFKIGGKYPTLGTLLRGYIGMILILTLRAVIQIRQIMYAHEEGNDPSLRHSGVIFPHIRRPDADKGVLQMIQFLVNFGFYKFGVETTLVTLVLVIGTRLDLFSVLYSLWLIPMFKMQRSELERRIWVPFIIFVAILLPLQYLSSVGLPPFVCVEYPWTTWDPELKAWLFLPDFHIPPDISRLIPDFLLLLVSCCQLKVFQTDESENAGSNDEILTDTAVIANPIPDFLSVNAQYDKSLSYLNLGKKCLFLSFYWVTLAIMFLTGTNRVNLFALGYLVGSFIFLWEGNEFYLRDKISIVKRWNYLLAYNVAVICIKSLLQLVGCVFLSNLQHGFCWLVQLFGIACLNKFKRGLSSEDLNRGLPGIEPLACEVPHDEAGLVWDGVTFAFLILQRRIFYSYYFFHIRAETEVQAKLASRGAELIEELMQNQIRRQEEEEKDVLEKIKMKMDRIKATHKKRDNNQTDNHFDGSSVMLSSPNLSSDEGEEEPEPQEPQAPLAVPISTGFSSTGPTPTPSSAATMMTLSVDGFFEQNSDQIVRKTSQEYEYYFYDEEEECGRTEHQHDESTSFPVFSPVSQEDKGDSKARRFSKRRRRPQSPSHHTSIRSGDYYMFDEDEDEIGMIDSISEEDEEDLARSGGAHRPSGVTLSELMSSALKTGDLETATEMAKRRRRRKSSRRKYRMSSDSTSDMVSGGQLSRQISTRTERGKTPAADWAIEEAPMEQGERTSDEESEGEKKSAPKEQKPGIGRRIFGYLRFAWALVESLMVSLTTWLNKFSKDYRHVAKCLSKEKSTILKEQLPSTSLPIPQMSATTDIDRRSIDSSLSSGDNYVEGSKDDLQTVIEKKSESDESISVSSSESTSSSPIICLIVAIWYVIISHSDLVCYFIVFLNQIKSSSILSLPLPLMVLLWGSLSVPRPTKSFWVTIIAYTEAMVVIKYLFQFDFFPWNGKANQLTKDPFWPPKILGIEKQEKYAVYDVVLLMVVFFHRFMLKSLGLWKNTGSAAASSQKLEISKSTLLEEPKDSLKSSGDDLLTTEESNRSAGCMRDCITSWERVIDNNYYGIDFLKMCVTKYVSSIREFFNQILNLEYKVKVDVYSYMFMCDFFNFLVVIFGFASFGSQEGDVSRYLEENKVPVPFLVMVIVQFALIVIDRALYLRKDIMGKFFFQITLATCVHLAMFFLLPYVTERDFNAKRPPQMWYMVKCIYLLLSAYQIRSGYPTRILGNFLCKKYNYVNMFLFKGFMAVPFLFELRALMDWIWTDTSMTLSDWLKLEDIFAHIFQLKCQRRVEKEYPQGRGLPKQRWNKYTIGGSSLFSIIAIIWFPLVLFALGNTVGIPNNPSDVSLEITLGSYQPIYTMSAQKNSLERFSVQNWKDLEYIYRRDKAGQNFLSNYEYEDVWVAKLNGNSSSIWGISPPSKDKLIQELLSENPLGVRIAWTITRDTNNPTVEAVARGKGDEVELTRENRMLLIEMINGTQNSGMKITGIFPKFLKVSNSGKAEVALQLNQALLEDRKWRYNKVVPASPVVPSDERSNTLKFNAVLRNLTLKLERAPGSAEEWWVVEEDCSDTEKAHQLPLSDKCAHLNLYTFNEKAFPPTLSFISGGGIIGLYTTLVLVASKFVRSFFSGISFLIMFDDMPNVDRIFQLCLDIYLVRESGELALEEDLFAKLIFLYRSPETLIKWTRPKKEDKAVGTDDQEKTQDEGAKGLTKRKQI